MLRRVLLFTVTSVFALTAAHADGAYMQSNIKMKLGKGGKIASMLSGPASKEGGETMRVAVEGDRKATLTGEGSKVQVQVIDLGDEQICNYRGEGKGCKCISFEEWENSIGMLKQKPWQQQPGPDDRADTGEAPEDEWEITTEFEETSKEVTVGGRTGKEALWTITAHKKGESIEKGGTVVRVRSVIGSEDANYNKIRDWDRKYIEKFGNSLGVGSFQSIADTIAKSPMVAGAWEEFEKSSIEKGGMPLEVEVWVDKYAGEQGDASMGDDSADAGGGPSKMMGRFAAKLKKKRAERKAKKNAESGGSGDDADAGKSQMLWTKTSHEGSGAGSQGWTELPDSCD